MAKKSFFQKLKDKIKRKNHLKNEEKIVIKENSISNKSESYNRLRDNILYLNADGNNKVLQIESSISHEGKTTIACNLAVSLGLTDKKVIVVDLDFRRPRVQHRFDLSIDNGIAEYMLGNLEKSQIIKHTKYKNVDVITRGEKVYNPSVILVSEKFRNFIKELRDEYDYVILDCAPVLQISEYIHILRVSDGVLFVAAYGSTTKAQISEAVKELRKNGANILGSIMSMYDSKADKRYGYYQNYAYNYYNSSDED